MKKDRKIVVRKSGIGFRGLEIAFKEDVIENEGVSIVKKDNSIKGFKMRIKGIVSKMIKEISKIGT